MAAIAQSRKRGFNAVNRGVYIADNLEFLRSLNDECIDLVCIDPPFAKNDTFRGDQLSPRLSQEELDNERRLLRSWGITRESHARAKGLEWPYGDVQGGYKDIWSWEGDVHEDWLAGIERDYENIYKLIDATRYVHGDDVAAYLCYMAVRVIEIRRVLKPTGSLYLHCDNTANGYLRQLLDGVFEKRNLRNEIFWRRTRAHNDPKRFGNIMDSIFFYSKSADYTWNTVYTNYSDEYIQNYFRQSDERGRFQPITLTGAGISGGESGGRWRGYSPTDSGRHWSIPRRIAERLAGEESGNLSINERLDLLDEHGYIYWPSSGTVPRVKQYLDEMPGAPAQNLWIDISNLTAGSKERTGYPTQKPVALAERIIQASSNPGDVVLDCFAGCAYVAIAAECLERRWVACDFNPRAWTVFKRQFNKPSLAVLDCNDQTSGQQVLGGNPVVTVHGPGELPQRTTPPADVQPQTFQPPERRFKVPASIIPEPEMLEALLELSDYKAWCCGFANRRPDGSIIRMPWNFHLDHLDPKSKECTSNDIQNRAPMCPRHNIRKNNRRVHLSDYRVEIADAGEMQVNTTSELIDLTWALAQANRIYGRAYARRYPLLGD